MENERIQLSHNEMIRLEQENLNTKEYYNTALVNHFIGTGLDFDDVWRINELLAKFAGGNLLDIGCGLSPACFLAKNKYPESVVYGLDFADIFINGIQTKYKPINYVVGNFYEMPFENSSFDYVILGEVIEHSEDPKKVIAESIRVLKSNGVLALSTPYKETKENHYYQQHIWSFDEEDIKDMIPNAEVKILNNNLICYARKS